MLITAIYPGSLSTSEFCLSLNPVRTEQQLVEVVLAALSPRAARFFIRAAQIVAPLVYKFDLLCSPCWLLTKMAVKVVRRIHATLCIQLNSHFCFTALANVVFPWLPLIVSTINNINAVVSTAAATSLYGLLLLLSFS